MAARQIIAKHYQRIIAAWPVDILRPQVTLQNTLRRREVRLTAPPPTSGDNIRYNEAQVTVPPPAAFDERGELEQVNALYSFLENRASKKWPLSEQMMKPESDPTHYEDVARELEEAPQRSWWQSKMNSWKGFLRLK